MGKDKDPALIMPVTRKLRQSIQLEVEQMALAGPLPLLSMILVHHDVYIVMMAFGKTGSYLTLYRTSTFICM